jgi:hypothetical protein
MTTEPLDRETVASHVVLITCCDHGQPAMTSTRTLVVNVTDVNDNKPIFSQTTYTGKTTFMYPSLVSKIASRIKTVEFY